MLVTLIVQEDWTSSARDRRPKPRNANSRSSNFVPTKKRLSLRFTLTDEEPIPKFEVMVVIIVMITKYEDNDDNEDNEFI